jgi:hypothetical protein
VLGTQKRRRAGSCQDVRSVLKYKRATLFPNLSRDGRYKPFYPPAELTFIHDQYLAVFFPAPNFFEVNKN